MYNFDTYVTMFCFFPPNNYGSYLIFSYIEQLLFVHQTAWWDGMHFFYFFPLFMTKVHTLALIINS